MAAGGSWKRRCSAEPGGTARMKPRAPENQRNRRLSAGCNRGAHFGYDLYVLPIHRRIDADRARRRLRDDRRAAGCPRRRAMHRPRPPAHLERSRRLRQRAATPARHAHATAAPRPGRAKGADALSLGRKCRRSEIRYPDDRRQTRPGYRPCLAARTLSSLGSKLPCGAERESRTNLVGNAVTRRCCGLRVRRRHPGRCNLYAYHRAKSAACGTSARVPRKCRRSS